MPWVGVIWLIFIVVRLMARSGGTAHDQLDLGTVFKWIFQRGKVVGLNPGDARSFYGRAGRREWTLGLIWSNAVGFTMLAVPSVGPFLMLPWFVLAMAVTARRLHDIGLSAWLQFLPVALCGALLSAGPLARALGWQDSANADLWQIAPAGAWFVAMASMGALAFMPGAGRSNAYGETDEAAA